MSNKSNKKLIKYNRYVVHFFFTRFFRGAIIQSQSSGISSNIVLPHTAEKMTGGRLFMKKRVITAFIINTAIVLTAVFGAGVAMSADMVFTNPALFEFIPSKITFEKDRVIVEGYFFNFTLDRVIHGIGSLEMEIYDAEDRVICGGKFASLSDSLLSMRLQPGYASLQVFEFNDTKRNPNDFNLEQMTAGIACDFTQSSAK